jgi:hypothetical protein
VVSRRLVVVEAVLGAGIHVHSYGTPLAFSAASKAGRIALMRSSFSAYWNSSGALMAGTRGRLGRGAVEGDALSFAITCPSP